RTTVGSTTKSGNVIPVGGATEPPLGLVVVGALGRTLAGGRDGGGEGADGWASAITATIEPAITTTSAASATHGRSIPFVAGPSPIKAGAEEGPVAEENDA